MKSSAEMETFGIGRNWGWLFLWGLLLFLLGIYAIGTSTLTTQISVLILGVLLLIGGGITIVDAFTTWWGKGSSFFFRLLAGILYVIAGIMLLRNPIAASISITLVLGIFYLVLGIYHIIYSVTIRYLNWGWGLFNGIITLLLGILILEHWPASGLFFIGLFVGIDLLFFGWASMMTALAARSLRKRLSV